MKDSLLSRVRTWPKWLSLSFGCKTVVHIGGGGGERGGPCSLPPCSLLPPPLLPAPTFYVKFAPPPCSGHFFVPSDIFLGIFMKL